MKSLFLVKKRSGHRNKIYTREGYIFQVQKYTGNLLKIYHLNDLFNIFPYYEFWGEL